MEWKAEKNSKNISAAIILVGCVINSMATVPLNNTSAGFGYSNSKYSIFFALSTKNEINCFFGFFLAGVLTRSLKCEVEEGVGLAASAKNLKFFSS